MSDLVRLLAPRSIAVVGATDGSEKIGGRIMSNLLRHRYAGQLYPININRSEVWGQKAYPTLADVPGAIDLALIAIPAAGILDALDACAAAGIKLAMIASSGFADAGEAGAALQQRLIAKARTLGIRIAGPNTQGFYNVPRGIAATFSPAVNIEPGPLDARPRIGIVSQSGGLGYALYNRGRVEGLDFSSIISIGNQADLELSDYADLLLDDSETRVLMLFLETAKTPANFLALAEKAGALEKPLVVAKVGRHTAARRAVATHTGSMAGTDKAYDAIFARYGVIRAESIEDMLDIAGLFTRSKRPRGNRVAVISATGGVGAWLTDTCEAEGLILAEVDGERQARLRQFIPPYGSANNPVDITAQGLRGYAQALKTVEDSPNHDAFILSISLAQEARIVREGDELSTIAKASDKPVLVYTYATATEKAKAMMAGWGFHIFSRMPGLARALAAGSAYDKFQRQRRAASPAPADREAAAKACAILARHGATLCEWETRDVFTAYGIALEPAQLVQDEEEAVAAAAAFGKPVALKIQSPDIPHKTEIGGVVLNLADSIAIRAAYRAITARAQAAAPQACILGMLVQPMATPGIEMIAGISRDPDFGPMLLCGGGGTGAELFSDIALAPVPLDTAQAETLIDNLKSAALLAGWRGAQAADRAAFADLLMRLSRLAADLGDRIRGIDLNPVIVHRSGEGLSLVDALIVQEETSS
ncbi:MAG TPA: acetate--CoA ligase family protein [Stellaceae bacterium]|jgi:acyl-CoA synthetase (NDP forming)|nr:acetate--CoA ligase family protein [Stellaceae bacterium]